MRSRLCWERDGFLQLGVTVCPFCVVKREALDTRLPSSLTLSSTAGENAISCLCFPVCKVQEMTAPASWGSQEDQMILYQGTVVKQHWSPPRAPCQPAVVTVMIFRVFRGRGESEITHEHK